MLRQMAAEERFKIGGDNKKRIDPFPFILIALTIFTLFQIKIISDLYRLVGVLNYRLAKVENVVRNLPM